MGAGDIFLCRTRRRRALLPVASVASAILSLLLVACLAPSSLSIREARPFSSSATSAQGPARALYIVHLRSAPPIVSYRGGIPGFPPIAPPQPSDSGSETGDEEGGDTGGDPSGSAGGAGGAGGTAGSGGAGGAGGAAGAARAAGAGSAHGVTASANGGKRRQWRVNPRLPHVRAFKRMLQRQQRLVAAHVGLRAEQLLYRTDARNVLCSGMCCSVGLLYDIFTIPLLLHRLIPSLNPFFPPSSPPSLPPPHQLRLRRQLLRGAAVPAAGVAPVTPPAVAAVRGSAEVRALTTATPAFLQLPQSLWAAAGGEGSAGEGVVVGVVDTGIWPEHRSFANDSSAPYGPPPSSFKGACPTSSDFPATACSGKLVGSGSFRAALEAGGTRIDWTREYASPRDAVGHGTWCAGAAAGNGNTAAQVSATQSLGRASGMAPRARIAMYKVLWRVAGGYGSGNYADLFAAVDQAVSDGVDVLSLSLGGYNPSATYFDDLPFLRAFEVGDTLTVVLFLPSAPFPSPLPPPLTPPLRLPLPPSSPGPPLSLRLPPRVLPLPSPRPACACVPAQAGIVVVFAAGNAGAPSFARTVYNFSPYYITVGARYTSVPCRHNLPLPFARTVYNFFPYYITVGAR
ncbi:unnamed protein product [Closterium sp. Naga37s-1]|nr:unnamed protein product [Closterium sp. Naga37s-1]